MFVTFREVCVRECAEIADGGRYDFLTRACVLRVAIAAHAVASDRTVSLGVRRVAQQRQSELQEEMLV